MMKKATFIHPRRPVILAMHQTGYTLTELMITVGIVGILAAVAIPSYNEYITVSRMGVAKQNAETIAGFVRTYYYEYDTHPEGEYVPGGTDTLTNQIDWRPDANDTSYKYAISACGGSTARECVDVVVTDVNDANITQTITISP